MTYTGIDVRVDHKPMNLYTYNKCNINTLSALVDRHGMKRVYPNKLVLDDFKLHSRKYIR